ncbi:uncharacterized protein BCR38DRAFT_202414 [Pseudomassariella vexata]|uniref:Uncharacterized protein n=1 Tax=Pseudomassariella vexata TaxID=1141098 RepID=A0A1Y2DZ51_9PEZI|nr:uncharacterized protein BCR38DRAFT_202414 [Pseudomassariella vexata]ORY63915.1 hypothetical protein BCR38DRAFT_202414 [Pseudomassariella vexata]
MILISYFLEQVKWRKHLPNELLVKLVPCDETSRYGPWQFKLHDSASISRSYRALPTYAIQGRLRLRLITSTRSRIYPQSTEPSLRPIKWRYSRCPLGQHCGICNTQSFSSYFVKFASPAKRIANEFEPYISTVVNRKPKFTLLQRFLLIIFRQL